MTENAVSGTCTNGPCNVVTQYQYDRAGNRTAIIDANGNIRRFTYDAANQQIEAIDGLNQVTGYSYDAGGRLVATDDPRGATNDLSYQYNAFDQPTSISATNLGTITQGYDALGQRTSLVDATGTVGYRYNARGERTQLIYPDTSTVQYAYWADGQLQSVTQNSTTLPAIAMTRLGGSSRSRVPTVLSQPRATMVVDACAP